MAYAQLADLPAYYGLYAAFLPPVVAALFGSSNQLATGPVAVVSLMTSTALAPLATAGSEMFIAYAIILALTVGIFQFTLGVLRLGLIVNFLSHPVVNGFTNAAAIIIATSQLSKLFGVDVDKAEHHYETVYNVVKAATESTHLPTLAIAILAFAIMIGLRKINRRIPNVLVAVIITTIISWAIGFEHNYQANISQINSQEVQDQIREFNVLLRDIDLTAEKRILLRNELKEVEKKQGEHSTESINLHHDISLLELDIEKFKKKASGLKIHLREYSFVSQGLNYLEPKFYIKDLVPADIETEKGKWRLKISNHCLDETCITLAGGGAVVGVIPKGLPEITLPKINISIMFDLLTMAVIISLLGFMEAISIAKAMASKTGQRLDPNQELIGQGLANIIGSFGQSYPVSGSFSRSAVNIQAGAVTGLSNVFSSIVVVITLIFFTPLLYHLPQAVLAAIIMMAVVGLLNVKGFIHAWQAQKYDGIIAIVSFVATLAFAPHLDKGIMIGVVLSLGHFLFRNIQPDMAILSKYSDGTYRNADRLNLNKCVHIAVVRYNNSLFFANVSYLEDKILEIIASMPELRHVHIVGNGINELDASGEEVLSLMVSRLREAGLGLTISGLNHSVLDVLHRTHLYEKIGENNFYGNVDLAVRSIFIRTHKDTKEIKCPLLDVSIKGFEVDPEVAKKMTDLHPDQQGEGD